MSLTFKSFLEEIAPGYHRLVVFDFDDTLVFSPTPEIGIPHYEKTTGKPWKIADSETALTHGFPKNFRRIGWWGRPETLHSPIFEPDQNKLNLNVAKALNAFKEDPQTYVVVMTGRGANLGERVKEILAHYNIHAHEYFFRGQQDLVKHPDYPRKGDTFDYKAFVIINHLMNPEIKSVEIFDDREEHISKFVELGKNLKEKWANLKSVLIHDVRANKNYNL